MIKHFKKIYHMLKDDANDGLTFIGANWAYQIKSVLESHGFGYAWQSQNIDTVPFNVIKQRILDNYYHTAGNHVIRNVYDMCKL